LRFWCPPSRLTANTNSATVTDSGVRLDSHRRQHNAATSVGSTTVTAGVVAASDRRPKSRNRNRVTAVTDNNAIVGCNAASVVNRNGSTPHPVFIPSCDSSITHRTAYPSTRSNASAASPTGTSVSNTHSSGSTPAGGSTSRTHTTHVVDNADFTSPRG